MTAPRLSPPPRPHGRLPRWSMALAALALSVLPATAAIPPSPRDIPQSNDPLWGTLRKTQIKVDFDKGVFTAAFPADVKAMAGRRMTITGYMLPLEGSLGMKGMDHFILSRYSPSCPFCPPGDPNEHIEIFTAKPQALTINLVQVSGKFVLQNDGIQGLFFVLDDAQFAK
jgi:hypothetical protein